MRHGGRVLVESLIALGARTSFGVPGESYLPVLDALHDTAGQLDFVLCRHEGGAAFMAAAWGKLTGSPGIAFVTRGPGATNAAVGVHTARQDSAPMLLFVGQVGTGMRGREAFQELDYRAVFGPLAKWAVEVDHVWRLPEILSRAWHMALTGRPGPVVVALPEDVLSAMSDTAALAGPIESRDPAATPRTRAEIRSRLAQADRPLLMVGGCGWDVAARRALAAFATGSDLPVIAAFRYQDLIDNALPVYCGEAGVGMPGHVRDLIRASDLIVALNLRFGEMTTGGYTLLDVPDPTQTLIHAHPDAGEIGKIYRPDLGVVCTPGALLADLEPVAGRWADWRSRARAGYEASLEVPPQPSPVDMGRVVRHLRARLPRDAIVTNGAGNFTVWPNKFLPMTGTMRLLAPQSGAMGYGLPAAIAAKVAHPERTVVCFAGDGDLQMTLAELGTAAQAGAAPVILVLNNGTYGTIRAHQERHFPARVSGTDLVNPDFAALARAYGFHGEHVARTDDFPEAFARALAAPNGALLDLAISAEALTPHQSLSAMRQAALEAL